MKVNTLYHLFSWLPNLLKLGNRRITVKVKGGNCEDVVNSLKIYQSKWPRGRASFFDELLGSKYPKDRLFYQISKKEVLFVNPRRTGRYRPLFNYFLIYKYKGDSMSFDVNSLLKYSSNWHIIFQELIFINTFLLAPIFLGIIMPIIEPIGLREYLHFILLSFTSCYVLGFIYYLAKKVSINLIIRLLISEIQKNYKITELKEEFIDWETYNL